MAGLGAKLFTAFSKLTAAQVNGYLMDQSIMRFASAAVRDAAFGGAGEPTLAEGMTCYLDDTNVLQSYNGSAWVTVVNTDRPAGLEMVTSCTATFVGGTAGSVSNGVVNVGTNNTSITVSNAFSATHDNYKIVYTNGIGSTIATITMTLGSTATGYYNAGMVVPYTGATSAAQNNNGASFSPIGVMGADYANVYVELISPFLTKKTFITYDYLYVGEYIRFGGYLNNTTSYTAFTISASSGSLTGGNIRVYGYRNQL
jgi:hypothetical protein